MSIPSISELQPIDSILPDRDNILILDSEDSGRLKLLKVDNIYIRENQTTFNPIVYKAYDDSIYIAQTSENNLEILKAAADSSARLTTVDQKVTTITTTSSGTAGTPEFNEETKFQDNTIIGPLNIIKFNDIFVSNIDVDISSLDTSECAPCKNYINRGTICLPRGTYKITCTVSISPYVIPQIDIPLLPTQADIDARENIWAFLSLYNLTSPKRFVINGDSVCTYTESGSTVTLNLNGFIYVDEIEEYGVTVSTIGSFMPGANTTSIGNTLSAAVPGRTLFNTTQINQSVLILEKLSNENVLLPTEDSVKLRRSQSFKYPASINLMYKSGWVTKLNAVGDTPSAPTGDQSTIKFLLFFYSETFDSIIGGARVYFSDPSSTDGATMNVGDIAKYRSELPDLDLDAVPINSESYDIRDSKLQMLTSGWWGYVRNDSEKTVGDKFDYTFRVDNTGVITSVNKI